MNEKKQARDSSQCREKEELMRAPYIKQGYVCGLNTTSNIIIVLGPPIKT